MNHVTHPLSYAELLLEISKFWYIISICFNFFWVFKDFFDKHGYNFDDVSKIRYSRPSWNKDTSK